MHKEKTKHIFLGKMHVIRNLHNLLVLPEKTAKNFRRNQKKAVTLSSLRVDLMWIPGIPSELIPILFVHSEQLE